MTNSFAELHSRQCSSFQMLLLDKRLLFCQNDAHNSALLLQQCFQVLVFDTLYFWEKLRSTHWIKINFKRAFYKKNKIEGTPILKLARVKRLKVKKIVRKKNRQINPSKIRRKNFYQKKNRQNSKLWFVYFTETEKARGPLKKQARKGFRTLGAS